jgi:integrase
VAPEAILRTLPIGTKDWRRVLGAILKLHNYKHAWKPKGVSIQTMHDRQVFYFGFFSELRRETRFIIEPRQLANRHIEEIVRRWIDRGLATATIHNYLSFLRSFAEWIGKPGLVLPPAHYVGADSPHAHRCQVPTEDSSWSARGIEIAPLIAAVAKTDSWVGLQLELCWRFGMRPKEARHFRPHEALICREQARPADAEAFPEAQQFVRIERGTKGGRPRDVPVETAEQLELIERLMTSVAPGAYVGWPGRTAIQNRTRFYYIVRRHGISKKQLGVVSHGLRHQKANDYFEADAGVPSPVRGGCVDAAQVQAAKYRVSRLLGHSRERAAAFYIGSTRGTAANESPTQVQAKRDGEEGDTCSPA